MAAIELENVNKVFGRGKRRVHAVVDNTLTIDAGQVYGFLGPNGAGKTTLIQMLLDLIRPTSGTLKIFGESVYQNVDVLRRVGTMIEGATFYPYLTGRKNLRLLARTHGLLQDGAVDDKRIDEVLTIVGMQDRANRRFRGFSLGMKQRLGLAAALLHDPDLLILDEPTNGLDPAGIQEMRYFIRRLVDEHGKTVFLSSHMLNEVEQTCDRVAIINNGAIIREGAVQDILDERQLLRIRAQPLEKVQAVMAGRYTVHSQTDDTLSVEAPADAAPGLIRELVAAAVDVYEIRRERQSLEAFFLTVTQEQDA